MFDVNPQVRMACAPARRSLPDPVINCSCLSALIETHVEISVWILPATHFHGWEKISSRAGQTQLRSSRHASFLRGVVRRENHGEKHGLSGGSWGRIFFYDLSASTPLYGALTRSGWESRYSEPRRNGNA